MRRGLIVGLFVLLAAATALPAGRTAAVDLASATAPWRTGEPAGEAPADPVTETAHGAPTTSSPPQADPVDRARGEADEGVGHEDGPPADLEISDDLPVPPLAPGVGALEQPAARPASPDGPHWVPFTGSRILWCVYRGAGRCNGHHPYPAIDVDMDPGTPVYAAGRGIVYQACNRGDACGGYGSHARILHPNDVRSIYGHFTRTVVRAGQTVRTGTLLGYSGCTGNCNGAHLHYEERNRADESIQIGQMQGYVGGQVVTYPNVWGYTSWTGIPPDRLRIRNDFFPEDDRDGDTTADATDECVEEPGPAWTSGCPLPPAAPDSADAAVADGAGNMRHNVVDDEGDLWQLTRYVRGWQWDARGRPGPGLVGPGATAVVATDGTAWAFAVDRDGLLWSGRQAQGRWLWSPVGSQGGGLTGQVAAAARRDGSIAVHVVDGAGHLWRAVLDQAAGWVWADLGAPGSGFTGSTPSSFTDGEGVVTTAVADSTGTLHRFGFHPSGASTVRAEPGPAAGLTGQRPAVLADRAGLTSVFAVGRDGHLWRLLRTYVDDWVWIDHGAVPGGNGGLGIAARHTPDRDLVVGVVDGSGRLRTSVQRGTLHFLWANLGAPAPVDDTEDVSAAGSPDGTGRFLVTAGDRTHWTDAVSGWSWTAQPGPPNEPD